MENKSLSENSNLNYVFQILFLKLKKQITRNISNHANLRIIPRNTILKNQSR